MYADHKPNPKRFEKYEPLPDNSGFKLPTGELFKFDKNGGWVDEYNNHYNCNGQPDDVEAYEDEDYYGEGEEKYDELVNEYIQNEYEDNEEDYDELYKNVESEVKINKMITNIGSYPLEVPITIEFENMNFKAKVIDIINFFCADSKYSSSRPIINATIDYFEEYKKKGTGRITTLNREFAKECVHKHGMKLYDRPLFLSLENFLGAEESGDEEVKVIKVETNELKKENNVPENKPIEKNVEHIEKEKKSELPLPVEKKEQVIVKEVKTEIKPKVEEKKEEPEDDDPWGKPIVKASLQSSEKINHKPVAKKETKPAVKKETTNIPSVKSNPFVPSNASKKK